MKVACSCGKTLQIPEALAGKGVRCPYCRAKIVAGAAPPQPGAAAPKANAAPAGGDDLSSLAAALGGAGAPAPPRAARPAARTGSLPMASDAAPVAMAAPAAKAVPVAMAAPAARPASGPAAGRETLAAQPKRRDKLPLIIASAAGGVLLIVVLIFVFGRGGGSGDSDAASEAAMPAHTAQPAAAAAKPRWTSGAEYDLFNTVPGNRTSKDYQREHDEREKKGAEAQAASSGQK